MIYWIIAIAVVGLFLLANSILRTKIDPGLFGADDPDATPKRPSTFILSSEGSVSVAVNFKKMLIGYTSGSPGYETRQVYRLKFDGWWSQSLDAAGWRQTEDPSSPFIYDVYGGQVRLSGLKQHYSHNFSSVADQIAVYNAKIKFHRIEKDVIQRELAEAFAAFEKSRIG